MICKCRDDILCSLIGDSRTTEHVNMEKGLSFITCDCRRLTLPISDDILHKNRASKNIDKGNSIVIYQIFVLVTGIKVIIVLSYSYCFGMHINMIDKINKNSDSISFRKR